VSLHINDDRFACQSLNIRAPATSREAMSIRRTLDPARLLEGRVTYADTGKPARNVEVRPWGRGRAQTDAHGRYRVICARGVQYDGQEVGILMAFPQQTQPYGNVQKEFHWPRGAVKHTLDIALPRGVLVRGRVKEKETGQPVAGTQVRYWAQHNNPHLQRDALGPMNYVNGRDTTASAADGTFRIACLPGPGYLTIEGPDADYVLHENGGYNRLYSGKHGGQPWWSHGFVALNAKPRPEPVDVTITLRKGVTIRGEVACPEGRPVDELQVFCRLVGFSTHPVQVHGHRFELHGCDPPRSIAAFFLDPARGWGATAPLSARKRGQPVRVQLQPLGSARVRFVTPGGKPVANFYPGLFLVLSPKAGERDAQTHMIASPLRKVGPHSDEDGYCTLTGLIPGATYQFGYRDIQTTFKAQSGKVVKVPDVILEDLPE
jgi:hypothetical protein